MKNSPGLFFPPPFGVRVFLHYGARGYPAERAAKTDSGRPCVRRVFRGDVEQTRRAPQKSARGNEKFEDAGADRARSIPREKWTLDARGG